MQKYIILGLLFLNLVGCATYQYDPPQETTAACYMPENSTNPVCIPVERDKDPTRFHYVRPWQQDRLPPIPHTL